MARLKLSLLGAFQAWLDEQPVVGFESNKVRALLAYLAVEADRPHPRESLAGLLWPDWPDQAALSNLRYALSNLRQSIGDRQAQPPFLLISRENIQFNSTSDAWLDSTAFLELAAEARDPSPSPERLESAAALYHGSFLQGFSVNEAAPFEEWALLKREQIGRQMMAVLGRLSDTYEQKGEWGQAQAYLRRQVELEPWNEEAHQKLMRALALGGQRSAALAQYEACRRLLVKELGVEPAYETTSLYEAIRDGLLERPSPVRVEELPAPGPPPYKGLQHFDQGDAALFFGREALVDHLVGSIFRLLSTASRSGEEERGDTVRFLAIIGASGSGKSSVLRAGLVPALGHIHTSESLAGDRAEWLAYVLTPTSQPLEALALSLTRGSSAGDTAALMDDLRRDPRSLHLYIRKFLGLGMGRENVHLILAVDQFEELFTLCQDEGERRSFIDNLLYAAGAPSGDANMSPGARDGPVVVVIALRADFYAHCAPYPVLREALSQNQAYIGPMSAAELRLAIEEPARRGGWSLEPGLADLLLHDVGVGDGQQPAPGALPLLSHALLETWQRRRNRRLTLAGYAETGGVTGAIARTAENTYSRLSQEEQGVVRSIFLRLAEIRDGMVHRRRARLVELVRSGRGEPAAGQVKEIVLKTLADARLVTTTADTVEVAHEALIREWARLRAWLEEDQESLRLHRRIRDAAREWERLGRDPGMLFRGASLVQALEWTEMHVGDLDALEQAFLDSSRDLAEREAGEREAQRQRELEAARRLAETERQRALEQSQAAQQLRRRAVFLAGALAAVLLLAFAVLFAVRQAVLSERQAEQDARTARANELAAEAINNLDVDPERSIWLAVNALASAVTQEAENALHRAVQASRARLTLSEKTGEDFAVAFSPDGKHLAIASVTGMVKVWDIAALLDAGVSTDRTLPATPLTLTGHTKWATGVAFSPDGKQLATSSEDGTVKIWDLPTGSTLLSLSKDNLIWRSVLFSPDGKRLAAGSDQGTVVIWDLASGSPSLTLLGHKDLVDGLSFSPDGYKLATAADQTVQIWELTTGRELFTLTGHTNGVSAVAFSPDGERLATSSFDSTARIWNAKTGEQLLVLYGHKTGLRGVIFSPDGQTLYTGGQDGVAKVWDVATGRELFTLAGQASAVNGIALSPDGRYLATAGRDGATKVWDVSISGRRELMAVPGFDSFYSGDGRRLTAISIMDEGSTSQLQTWAVSADEVQNPLATTLLKHTASIIMGTSTPDKARFATATDDLSVHLWDASGQNITNFSAAGKHGGVESIELSPDGRLLAVANEDGTITLWSVDTGKESLTITENEQPAWDLAFSPDGQRLASGSVDSIARIWDTATGRKQADLKGHTLVINTVAFDAHGTRLATAGMDASVRIWDARTGQELLILKGHTATVNVATFSLDGTRVATGSNDGTARIWDAANGKELLILSLGGGVYTLAFNPDGTQLAVGSSEDGAVRVYLLRLQDLLALAKSRLTRPPTTEECQKYLHMETCP